MAWQISRLPNNPSQRRMVLQLTRWLAKSKIRLNPAHKMANQICTVATLNIGCFSGAVINQQQRKSLLVFFKANELKLIGGTDYTAVLTSPASTGLLGATYAFADGKVSNDFIGERIIGILELAVAHNTAIAAGFANATINSRMDSIKCLVNVTEAILDRMIIFLDCQLGVHKTYPQ